MKKSLSVLALGLLYLIMCKNATSQITVSTRDTSDYPYWIQMMQDPGANYFVTVSAFEKYWKNQPIKRSSGWKVFKRWEYIMKGRISSDGAKPAPDNVYNSWKTFTANNKSVSGSWVSLGPASIPSPGPAGYEGLGRLNVVAFYPTNQNKIYAGSPSGGLWLSGDNGSTWTRTERLMRAI